MKKLLLLACVVLCVACKNTEQPQSMKMINQIDFSHVQINDAFWSPRLEKHKTATLPVCIDQIENQTGRIRNFENAAKGEGEHSGIFFDDSDVYKALEGIAYSLINHPDSALEAKADEWIDKFAAAQQPDGYINTFYTLTGLDKRWTDMDRHEMYCAGHMTEAAVAYYLATGKRKLLDVAIRMADHMMSVFGPDKRHWVPGHEEIELALVKLSQVTGEEKYLDFAHWLLEERGHGHGSYGDEREWNPAYYQDNIPVKDMTTITGHAVRTMYLYCGMADVAALKNDTAYIATMERLWDVVVNRNMYITGGIGSSGHNEGFSEDYDLPNKEAYCETCASVGMVLWNHRMNQFTGDAKYIDVLERAMYNGALAGCSLDGDRFFYVNPLESDGNHHRQEWYGCACCPSQISRFLPSIGNYIYGESNDALWVNLYIGNKAQFSVDGVDVTIEMNTNYPWEGKVQFVINTSKRLKRALRFRVPGWCKQFSIDGKSDGLKIENGYAVIDKWQSGDAFVIDMAMPVEKVVADPRVKADEGKVALQRGPIVFCAEEVDNPNYDALSVSDSSNIDTHFDGDLLSGVQVIDVSTDNKQFRFIPYYAWDNRQAGRMKVWVEASPQPSPKERE